MVPLTAFLLVLLLFCPANASTTAPATGLQAEEPCLGIGTNSEASACLGKVALVCLGMNAVTEEATFLPCFSAGLVSEQCWAGTPKVEEHCIGIAFSKERERCIGLVGWSCRDSRFGSPGFMACFFEGIIHCIF